VRVWQRIDQLRRQSLLNGTSGEKMNYATNINKDNKHEAYSQSEAERGEIGKVGDGV
jgi:hypothetical protein